MKYYLSDTKAPSLSELIKQFSFLGWTSFGGPTAHLAYFREAFVEQKRWLSEQDFATVLSLCQLLPGPTSSQVGYSIGHLARGWIGGLLAWLCFTLPSVLLLVLAAIYGNQLLLTYPIILHSLKVFAFAAVGHATISMAEKLLTSQRLMGLAILAAGCFYNRVFPPVLGLILIGLLYNLVSSPNREDSNSLPQALKPSFASLLWTIFLVVSALSLTAFAPAGSLPFFANKLITASLSIFGGGHVVLPMLEEYLVQPGWLTQELFLTGYSLAQTIPGPLFSMAGYLGAVLYPSQPWVGASVGVLSIYLVTLVTLPSILHWWEHYAHKPWLKHTLKGLNAGVVGLLLATWIHPVATDSIHSLTDFMIGTMVLIALKFRKFPNWSIIVSTILIESMAQALGSVDI